MLRSRVLSSIDTARLADAVARPGIDPRVWVSYAVLASDPVVVTTEGRQDVIANITLLPSATQETARVGAVYAGNGFGLYAPLYEGDEVLVVAPSGDPDQGLVITQRLWSPADLPPAEIADHPEDVTLVVQEGKSLRITTKGAGNVYLTVDTGKIYLGSPNGAEPVAKGDSLKSYLDSLQAAIAGHTHIVTGTATPAPPSPNFVVAGTAAPSTAVFPTASPAILATTTEVK